MLKKLLEAMPRSRKRKFDMLQRFLDPKVLAGISGLDLVAKTVVDGFIAGLHRSPDFGFSQEFAEYRAYSPGDDLRHVDWNVYARTERMFLKRYRGETNSQLTILLDASRSMKFTLARDRENGIRAFPGGFARLSGAASSATPRADRVRRRSAQLRASVDAAGAARADSARHRKRAGRHAHRFRAAVSHVQEFLRRRGMVVAISDFWEQPEKIIKTVEPLRYRGNGADSVSRAGSRGDPAEAAASGVAGGSGNRRSDGSFARLHVARISRQDRRAY